MVDAHEQRTPEALRVMISGGGTGGQIFPAIAIANAVREQVLDARFLFVGAEGKMEMEKVPAAGYAIEGLPIRGFQREQFVAFFQMQTCQQLLGQDDAGGIADGGDLELHGASSLRLL